MNKLYTKSELWFAIIWIIIYITGTIIFDNISSALKIINFLTPLFYVILCTILLIWIFKNKLNTKYGLCKSPFKSKYFLFFIPLIILISINFWFGLKSNIKFIETLIFIITMLCVGFLEEIIFRGFLFTAMKKDSLKWAIIISSLTFGFGHIINLFSANAEFLPTILQICYSTTTGFLFVILFYKGKTLLPCILTHSIFNSLSIFAANVNQTINIITTIVIMILTLIYAVILIKILPEQEQTINNNKELK
ncbi:MAG: CPBP family intramembrane metalloprotease [Clostridia bacterium]|nr:CPBP family intramembrane metalloprotease [Clostridia bacterium]